MFLHGFYLLGIVFLFWAQPSWLACAPVKEAPEKSILFYNPESNVDSFAAMKTMMDRYLKKTGAYTFQPFNDRDIFEKFLMDRRKGIVILSSWHFQILKQKLSLKPSLVGVVEGKTTQVRILVSKNADSLAALGDFTVASAGSEAYSESILVEMLFARQRPIGPMPQILIVPKDIDALMAVGFDLATAALTSKSCLDMLITINPRLHEKLNVIEISQTFLHPLVTTIEVGGDLPGEARDFFEGMANTTEGRRCLDVIGLDNWKKLSQADWELLGQPEKGN